MEEVPPEPNLQRADLKSCVRYAVSKDCQESTYLSGSKMVEHLQLCCAERLHGGLASLRDPLAKFTAVKRLAIVLDVQGALQPHVLCERVEQALLTANLESNRHPTVEAWVTELERQIKRMRDEAGASGGGKVARGDDGGGGTRGVETPFVTELASLMTSQHYGNQLQRLQVFASKVGNEEGYSYASMLELFLTAKTPEELKPTEAAARRRLEVEEDALEPLTLFHQIFNLQLSARRVDAKLCIVENCLSDDVFAELLVTLVCRHYCSSQSSRPSRLVTLRLLKLAKALRSRDWANSVDLVNDMHLVVVATYNNGTVLPTLPQDVYADVVQFSLIAAPAANIFALFFPKSGAKNFASTAAMPAAMMRLHSNVSYETQALLVGTMRYACCISPCMYRL